MTKKQMAAACVALAPDFRMTFDAPCGVQRITAKCTDPNGSPYELVVTIGGRGRASVETHALETALGFLRRRTNERAA